jgi:hypothetical protein
MSNLILTKNLRVKEEGIKVHRIKMQKASHLFKALLFLLLLSTIVATGVGCF